MSMLGEIASLQFLTPEAFWLFVPVSLLLVASALKSPRGKLVLLLRAFIYALFILALSSPVRTISDSEQQLSALVDVSHSVSPQARRALVGALRELIADFPSNVSLLPFAGSLASEPVVISATSSAAEIEDILKQAAKSLDTGSSQIANAISAFGARTQSSSVLLLSDGFETTGDARAAAQNSGAQGLAIFPVVPSLEAFTEERLFLSSLHVPLTVFAGDKAEVRVSAKNTLSVSARGEIELWLDDKQIAREQILIPGKQEKLLVIPTAELQGGLSRVRAVLKTATGASTEVLSELHRWVSVKERAKLLLISGAVEDERVLKRLLQERGFVLESRVADGSGAVPTNLQGYSRVVLNNASKRQLPEAFLPALKNFVRSGGGLLILGGERSFGLGDYIGTELEEVSPVSFVPPQTTKKRLNNAVVLVIDKSRSMAVQQRMEAAKRAAFASVNSLKDDDFVSVIGFDSTPFVIIRMEQVSVVKPIAEQRLRNLTAAGGTNLLAALSQARIALRRTPAGRLHVVVLTDGKIPNVGEDYLRELGELSKMGATISTIALGTEADVPFLKMVAERGKGSFYQTLDPNQLAQIFIHDIQVSTGEKTMQEQADFFVAIGADGLSSTTVKSYPPLRGFVETRKKAGAQVELLTDKNGNPFPLLASWGFEKGRVAAFASDASGRWSSRWMQWRDFVPFWVDVLNSIQGTARPDAADIDFDLRYSVSGSSVLLDLAVFDSSETARGQGEIKAKVTSPTGEISEVLFRNSKPGRSEAMLPNGQPGDYKIEIEYGEVKFPPLAITLTGEAFGEKPGRGLNSQLLSDIAQQSGGAVNPKLSDISLTIRESENRENQAGPFILLAFCLVFVEAFIRELASRTSFSSLMKYKEEHHGSTKRPVRKSASA